MEECFKEEAEELNTDISKREWLKRMLIVDGWNYFNKIHGCFHEGNHVRRINDIKNEWSDRVRKLFERI